MKITWARSCFSLLSLVLLLSMVGCSACSTTTGGGGGGGAPYVWICTPAYFSNAGSNTGADIYVFNGSGTNANVSVNILDKSGNNLAGHNIPGTSPAATYPGQTGNATVSIAPSNTLYLKWQTPVSGGPGFDGVTDVSYTVRVTSDQPIAVSSDFQWNGFHPVPCSLLPK